MKKLLALLAGFGISPVLAYAVGGIIVVLFAALLFARCGKSEPSKINEREIQDNIENMRQREDERLANTLNRSDNRVREIEANVRQASFS